MKLPLKTMKEAIVIGAGASGISASKLLRKKGFAVRLLEKKQETLSKEQKDELESLGIILLYGDFLPYHAEQADFIVVSPGIPIKTISSVVYGRKEKKNPFILGEIELAYTFLEGEHIIAITGTAGKTTTVSLLAKILEDAGLQVFLGGNIGTPLSEYVLSEKKVDVIVLELSSFQLQGMHYFKPKVASILNISPNHLDYHKSMDEYVQAKLNIVKRQTKDDFFIIPESLEYITKRNRTPSFVRMIKKFSGFLPQYLLGTHNMNNIEIAYQASKIFGVSKEQAGATIATFKSLPHRLEYVAMQKGVLYINDSKSTTVESLNVALEAMESSTILLAGGKFKGGELSSLRDILQKKCKQIVLFGGSKEIFLSAWDGVAPIEYCSTLEEAVEYSKQIATHGDVVLLSPATSSFDAFQSYIERGEAFKKGVLGGVALE